MSSAVKKPKIAVVVGPTASGKTDLGIKIAKKFNGEIVSADSRQIYRGMDIGTAKPTRKEMANIPHYLLDIKNPDEDYAVAEYKSDAVKAIRKILKKGKLPILVGGTGLYVKAVVENLEIPKVAADPKLRQELETEIETKGLQHLFNKLVELDPEAAYIIDPKNPRRVIRALEVALKTKKPFSSNRKRGGPLFDAIEIGINLPKEKLRKKINVRVDQMIKNGLVDEVKNLVKKYGEHCRAFDAIGYREIIDAFDKLSINPERGRRIDYLQGRTSLQEAAELIKKNTWGYSKRQMTWFKKDRQIHWAKSGREPLALVKKFLLGS